MSLTDRALHHLRTTAGNCTVPQVLARVLGVPTFRARAVLQRLERQGLVDSSGHGPCPDMGLHTRVVLWMLP